MDQKWIKIGSKTIKNEPKRDQKGMKNGPKTDQKWIKNASEVSYVYMENTFGISRQKSTFESTNETLLVILKHSAFYKRNE